MELTKKIKKLEEIASETVDVKGIEIGFLGGSTSKTTTTTPKITKKKKEVKKLKDDKDIVKKVERLK